MPQPSNTIETKAKAMAKAMNEAIAAKRKAKIAELEKAAKAGPAAKGGGPAGAGAKSGEDFDKKLWRVEMQVSKSKVTLDRTPEEQALSCAKGESWTCSSSHMLDMARHVDLRIAAPGTNSLSYARNPREPFGTKDEHFMTFNEWTAEWNKAMKAQGLRNYEGGEGFAETDAYHVELPDSRVPQGSREVQACLAEYARLTRKEGYKPNTTFENSAAWKNALKPHIDAVEAEKRAAEEAKRLEALRKLRLTGALTSQIKLGRALSKNTKPKRDAGGILPPTPIDAGARKVRPARSAGEVSWDSIGRDLLEKLGLKPTSSFDIKVVCEVSYGVVSYKNLSQGFLEDLTIQAEVLYNTPIARFCKIDIDATVQVALKAADAAPKGSVVFDIRLTAPAQKFSETITLKVD